MSLPPFLLAEIRHAFRSCAQQHAATRLRPFSSSSILLKRKSPSNSSHPSIKPSQFKETPPIPQTTKDLIPQDQDEKSLDPHRRSSVPAKVIPPSTLSPDAPTKLTPMQRLHIEHLTRHPPKKSIPKPYKERLLIYSFGFARVYALVFMRIVPLFVLSFVTFVAVPAYYFAGNPWYYVLLSWALTAFPIVAVNYISRPVATEIFLHLPAHANLTPEKVMNYARSLPRDAKLEVRFLRWTGFYGRTNFKILDTRPASSWLRPVSFKNVGPKEETVVLRPAPTEFYVMARSAGGKGGRDTVPGIWDVVYRRLTGKEVPKYKA
jgi:hypothetical protein